jgi:hypothetical protein
MGGIRFEIDSCFMPYFINIFSPVIPQGGTALMKIGKVLLLALMLFLAGCQAATPEPIPTNTTIPPTSTLEPTATVEVVANVDYCVDCHTDKEQLISTAKPEETAEEESSGVG